MQPSNAQQAVRPLASVSVLQQREAAQRLGIAHWAVAVVEIAGIELGIVVHAEKTEGDAEPVWRPRPVRKRPRLAKEGPESGRRVSGQVYPVLYERRKSMMLYGRDLEEEDEEGGFLF